MTGSTTASVAELVAARRPILLMGPTASGKSALALALAERLPVEIVSVDSAQVFRGMDIGTAKPGAVDRARVAHHLIDLIDPVEAYSAARFRRDALALIAAIRRRGRIPLLVGGTMLYFRALRLGLARLPGADAGIRSQLEAEALREGWPALHARLAKVDPVTAARLEPADAQRIQRALEVWLLTGQPVSRLLRDAAPWDTAAHERAAAESAAHEHAAHEHAAHEHAAHEHAADEHAAEEHVPGELGPHLALALVPGERAELHRRIERRFDRMLDSGLVDELADLRARWTLHRALPSMRCVGYRQAWDYLEGAIDRDQLRARGIAATRQLAKRQLTWLRRTEAIAFDGFDSALAGRVTRLLSA